MTVDLFGQNEHCTAPVHTVDLENTLPDARKSHLNASRIQISSLLSQNPGSAPGYCWFTVQLGSRLNYANNRRLFACTAACLFVCVHSFNLFPTVQLIAVRTTVL